MNIRTIHSKSVENVHVDVLNLVNYMAIFSNHFVEKEKSCNFAFAFRGKPPGEIQRTLKELQ